MAQIAPAANVGRMEAIANANAWRIAYGATQITNAAALIHLQLTLTTLLQTHQNTFNRGSTTLPHVWGYVPYVCNFFFFNNIPSLTWPFSKADD